MRLLLATFMLMATSPAAFADNNAPLQSVTHQSSRDAAAEQQIQQAFDAWLAAVSSGSSEAVTKLYARDAILLPTLSPKVAATPEDRKAYFDAFTSKPGLKGTVNEEHIRVFGHTAINSGLYTFTYLKDGATVEVPARFSFVYRKTPQGWLIVDHHSSKLPVVEGVP